MVTRVYLAPGMFGFARLVSFEYFGHVASALRERLGTKRRAVEVHVCDLHPTASIRRRAAKLAHVVAETAGSDGGPIHLVGHSTGGLDARLVASPHVDLPGCDAERLAWLPRLRSITTINTPHHGTPLAGFFATVSGQRLLYATSALTVAALKIGAPPLAVTSALVAAFGRINVGRFELELVDRTVETLIRALDEAASRELRAWLRLLRDDQGAIVQLMPEAMDLFQAAVKDREHVRYYSVATYVPADALTDWLAAIRSPYLALSSAIFATLYRLTARHDERYACAPAHGTVDARLRELLGELPPVGANDGVVPLRSQVWGELLWAGKADHHDIVGHFRGPGAHTDWLASGARFSRARFDSVMDRIAAAIVAAEAPRPVPTIGPPPSLRGPAKAREPRADEPPAPLAHAANGTSPSPTAK